MKCKKLIAMGMAAVTALSLGIPALAEDTVITGMYNEIKIDVDIPTVGTAVINPYSMPVKAMYQAKKADGSNDGDPVEVATLTTAGKIATQPLIGISRCEVALDVGATVTGTAKGSLTLGTKDISAAKNKSAVIYLECKQDTTLANSDVSDTASDKPISGVKGASAVAAFNAWAATTYDWGTTAAAETANKDKVLVSAAAKTKLGLCTLAAAQENNTTHKMEPQTGSFLLARLGGDVVQNPTEAWTAKDGVVVTVAFTFTPAAPKEGGEITLSEESIAAGPTATVAAPEGVTFGAGATYKWELVTAGDSGVAAPGAGVTTGSWALLDEDAATAALVASKPFSVKCTVVDGGITYVSTAELTLAA